jgi:hypothetical protein
MDNVPGGKAAAVCEIVSQVKVKVNLSLCSIN